MVTLYKRANACPVPEGLVPVRTLRSERIDIDTYIPELTDISRRLWVYLGYTALMRPWHDNPERITLFQQCAAKFRSFFWTMDQMDVDWRSYCVLSFLLRDYTKWERALLLIKATDHWSWMRKLREYAGSAQRVDEITEFILYFVQLQIEYHGKCKIRTSKSIRKDVQRGMYYAVYHEVADRLSQLESDGVDYISWLEAKFQKCVEFGKLDFIYLSVIVNQNGLDPDLGELRSDAQDSWSELRAFLSLSKRCEFPDGAIPKGWTPAGEDMQNPVRIVKITADGFYFYENGEQRRGKFHYAKNKYQVIRCTPENFGMFKGSWGNPAFLTARPTWEEYSKWGLYPDMWTVDGSNTNGRGPAIKWRKG